MGIPRAFVRDGLVLWGRLGRLGPDVADGVQQPVGGPVDFGYQFGGKPWGGLGHVGRDLAGLFGVRHLFADIAQRRLDLDAQNLVEVGVGIGVHHEDGALFLFPVFWQWWPVLSPVPCWSWG